MEALKTLGITILALIAIVLMALGMVKFGEMWFADREKEQAIYQDRAMDCEKQPWAHSYQYQLRCKRYGVDLPMIGEEDAEG